MNTYRFEELNIGQEEEFSVKVTEEMMKSFLEISGDNNPLHCDEDFAKEKGFNGRVVYGMLTASFLSTLAGVYLPGKYCLIQQVETKFVKPVKIGDTLTVKGVVKELNDTVKQMVMQVTITNGDNEKVLRGQMKIGFLHE